MRPIVDQIKALLTAAGIDPRYVDATGANLPYVLLWGSPGQPGIESSIAADDDLSDVLGVTCVDTTPGNVLRLSGITRGVLAGARFTAGGLLVWLAFLDSQTVQADRQVVLPETNRHPFFAVDRDRLIATPA